MGTDSPAHQDGWITGSPWGDLRAHARLSSAASEHVIDVSYVQVMGRSPAWGLTNEGHAEFRVPCARDEFKRLPVTSAHIEVSSLFRSGQAWIRLICNNRELEGVFFRFCESLILELREGMGATEALTLVLNRFRQLFELQEGQVSPERVVGLFAELVVLEKLLDAGIDAVSGWLGPTRETHDFVFGAIHLEVKALRASGARSFRVSNIHQMESPEGTELFLAGVRIAPGSHTIGAMVERIRSRISPQQVRDLEAALETMGCQYPVNPEWNEKRFSALEPEVWRVDETFPRLVASMLPNGALPAGVSGVQYTVSLESVASGSTGISSIAASISGAKGS